MSTTTIRLPDELKARLARLAKGAGITPHAFILQAIEERTEQADAEAEFHRLALQRWAEFKRTGEAISQEEMRRYVNQLAAGGNAALPNTRKVLP